MAEIVHRAEFPVGTYGGGCAICRAPRRPEEAGIIDCGVMTGWPEGILCLCEQCVRWMAHLVGYPTQETIDAAYAERDEAVERASKMAAQVKVHEDREAEVKAQRALLMSMIGEIRAKKLTP